MKKIVIILNLLVMGFTYAQTNLTSTENYVYEKNCLTEDCSKKTESVQYFDGLGRAKQSIAIKATPTGKDIAIPVEYDMYGRQVKSYLPIPQSGTQNGAIYTSPLSNASSQYGSEKIYAEKILEFSPLGRIEQQKQIGNDWASHPVQFSYATNTSADGVKKYTVVTTWLEGRTNSELASSGTYDANTLYKSTVTDEDGNIATTFKNKKGQTVLTRKKDGTQNVDTYYVYNEYGQLAYTIPPLASVSALTSTVLDNLCYQYRYDGWNRLVEKKIPGKGWEYMIYDKADQLVMSQDANLKAQGKWQLAKYDQFGRVVLTGITNNTTTRQSLQTNITAATYTFEIRSSGSFTISGMPVYYTNRTLPGSLAQVLSINYYDTYPNYSFNPAFPSAIMGKNILTDNSTNNAVSTKSLPVMSLVKNVEDDNWTKSYVYYDAKGRVIGTYSINHLGGYTKTESDLDFIGVPQKSNVYHVRKSGEQGVTIKQRYVYDSQNRLLQHYHQVDDKPEQLLSENTYNELSQLTNKKVGNNLQSIDYTYNILGAVTKINDPENLGNNLFGFTIKYNNSAVNPAYNKYNGNIAEIDWKTSGDGVLRRYTYSYDSLNRLTAGYYQEPQTSVPFNNFYNEEIAYDLNGNIQRLQRNMKNTVSNTAEYVDNLYYNYTGNRLISVNDLTGNYKGYPDTSGNTIGYNDNGSMTSHPDKGILQMDYNILDLPQYIKFNESIPGRDGSIYINTKYTYLADGTKLRKEHTYKEPSNFQLATKTTDYIDGFQYEATVNQTSPAGTVPVLKFVPTAEGYYNFENNKYIYQYKDHLGNVRVSYFKNTNGSAEVLEENNYYPFGLKHEGYNTLIGNPANKYQYNGKELQQETGMYSYGWREYMPDIARWNGIDQLAESYLSTSTYAYVANNPVSYNDVDGRWFDQNGNIIDTSGQTYGFLGSSYKPRYSSGSLGVNYRDSSFGGGGNYLAFGQTSAYADLMDALKNGRAFSLTTKNGYMKWWTGTATQTTYKDGDELFSNVDSGMMHSLKVNSDTSWDAYKNWADYGSGTIGTMYQAIADQRTSLYNRGYWIDNLGNQRSIAYAGRAVDSQIGLRSNYLRTTAKFGKYAKGAGYIGYALGAYEVGEGLSKDGWSPGKNTTVAAAKVSTGIIVSGTVGAGATWLTGALAGAAGGSVAPGVGTIIGFVVGGVAGYFASDYVGELVENSYK